MNRPHSNERFAYDDYKTDLDAGMSCVHPAGDERGESAAALFERSDGVSWQGRCDDHRGVSTGQYGGRDNAEVVGTFRAPQRQINEKPRRSSRGCSPGFVSGLRDAERFLKSKTAVSFILPSN